VRIQPDFKRTVDEHHSTDKRRQIKRAGVVGFAPPWRITNIVPREQIRLFDLN
jgi:hypothetical protein